MKQIYTKPEFCILLSELHDILTDSGLHQSVFGIGDIHDCRQW